MIPRYREIMVSTTISWCNLALDGNLNDTSIIYLLSKISPIGLKKPMVKAKGINHPKVSTHGVLLPVSSASLLSVLVAP